ncbi:MAG: hypothetical protein ACK4TN_04800, partial [Brevinematales bacterium]
MSLIKWDTDLTRKGGQVLISGLPVAMHCHHYNINLQAMLEARLGNRGIELMYRSAEEATYMMFKEYFRRYTKIRSTKSRIELACTLYQNCGLGVIHFIRLDEEGGEAVSPSSHHVTGWLAKHGIRDTPGCHFARGWLSGFCEILFGKNL